jgi:hypothetical protein
MHLMTLEYNVYFAETQFTFVLVSYRTQSNQEELLSLITFRLPSRIFCQFGREVTLFSP